MLEYDVPGPHRFGTTSTSFRESIHGGIPFYSRTDEVPRKRLNRPRHPVVTRAMVVRARNKFQVVQHYKVGKCSFKDDGRKHRTNPSMKEDMEGEEGGVGMCGR